MKKKKISMTIMILIIAVMIIGVKVNAKNLEAKVEIDHPYIEQVEKNILNYQGWVMSEDKDAKIEIYIDGQKQKTNIERYERKDVLEAIKGYGGKETNKTPGYRGSIDITNLTNGEHKFSVIVKSGAKEELTRKENTFKVKDYEGKVEIDNPLINTKVKTNLNFKGWVMSEDKDAKVEVYIDGQKQNANIERYEREDVIEAIKGYGGIRINSTPGYRGSIDTASLKDGVHTFTTKVISKNGQEIISKTNSFNIEKYESKIEIDYPYIGQIEQNKLNYQGWVMSEAKDAKVEIYIDGQKQNANIERYEREDVIEAIKGYGGKEINKTPGYRGSLDITTLTNGEHSFLIKVIVNQEVIAQKENKFIIKNYEGKVEIDRPTNGDKVKSKIKLQGWVMSEDKDSQIEIYVDDKKMTTKIERYEREDVLEAIKGYGGKKINKTPGYRAEINLEDIVDGEHILTVKILSAAGIEITNKKIKINLKKYETKIEVDTPFDTKYDKENIEVKGWVLSEDKDREIEVYIDGVKQVINLRQEEREDVLEAIKGYGGKETNNLPGYRGSIDYKQVTEGYHELTVKVIASKTKEILAEKSRKFHVNRYNTKIEIDSPLHQEKKKTSIEVRGWAMSEDKDGEIKIYLDGQERKEKIERYEREDVLEVIKGYGGRETNKTPGYRLTIDASNISDGEHKIRVEFISSESKEATTSLTNTFIIKKYEGMLCIDSPILSNFNSAVEIIGWELSELDGSYIKASIDNYFIDANFKRVERQDVFDYYKNLYGGATTTPLPGFEGKIDLANIPEGKHTIKIYLCTKLNEVIETYSKEIYVYKNEFFGIDVSQHNGGLINWLSVKRNGIDYAIIRAGVRGYAPAGNLREDANFYKNVTGATNAGLKVGAYIFSQAINEQEAIEEANLAIRMVNLAGGPNKIKLPIVFDSEYSGCKDENNKNCGRADKLSREERTNIAKAFLDTVRNAGYTPMIYASSSFLDGQLNMSRLSNVDVWVAHYNTERPSYKGMYQMWQYSSTGTVPGISGFVDLNKIYKRY